MRDRPLHLLQEQVLVSRPRSFLGIKRKPKMEPLAGASVGVFQYSLDLMKFSEVKTYDWDGTPERQPLITNGKGWFRTYVAEPGDYHIAVTHPACNYRITKVHVG